MGQFTCNHCGGVFKKGWTDAEAEEEAERLWMPEELTGRAIICEDCFQRFINWCKGK